MEKTLKALLEELEQFGLQNDAIAKDSANRMLNITRETGELLMALIHATGAQRILEIGTSNGYSTLWLAHAAGATGGRVTTVEASDHKVMLAEENFRAAGLASIITVLHDRAHAVLARSTDSAYDFIFLDAGRNEYPRMWSSLKRVLRRGGSIVADNATSHPGEIAPFMDLVKSDPDFLTALLPVGKGEFLAVKAP